MKNRSVFIAACLLAACSPDADRANESQTPAEADTPAQPILDNTRSAVDALHMYQLDCGRIEISDLDGFSSAGDYAGLSDTYADTCWLVRHPEGDFLWDLGLPSGLVGSGRQENGVFTISMEQSLSDQLAEIGLFAGDIETISLSHSHFDHSGQADQFPNAKWLVHADEYAAMFPPVSENESADGEDANSFVDFADLTREEFTGEQDVFGDGSVIIIPTPGHTPGHTSLLVTLPETGPILLTGDLYHRRESRELGRVPRFNSSEEQTRASMAVFEARAEVTGARIIIQHEPLDVETLPMSPAPIP